LRSQARCVSLVRWGSKSKERPAALVELAFISIGSNLDPEHHLPRAIEQLGRLGRLRGISGVYQNPAISGRVQPDYLNVAVLLEVDLSLEELRGELRKIEADQGRVRTGDKNAPRTIDLDLSLFGDQVLSGADYQIPDPELTRLAHLAIPLAELAPEYRHPSLDGTLRLIADRLRPGSKLVRRSDLSEQFRTLLAPGRTRGR
jgi:2-amino-4-hydroxy-6-hydroxymethyldihydropteridine diphosphokinase